MRPGARPAPARRTSDPLRPRNSSCTYVQPGCAFVRLVTTIAKSPASGERDTGGLGMRTAPLTAQARQDALDALRASAERGNELDVLVIGGGVTGAGIALDAV